MAGRVNTKFVVALIAVLTLLPVSFFGYWFMFIRADAAKLTKLADEHMTQGSTDQAIKYYVKAIAKQTDDVGLMLKYVQALTQAKTSDPRTARRYVGQMITMLHRAITQEPHNPVPFEQLMQLYMKLGRDMNDFGSWQRMYEDADARLLRANAGQHEGTLAKKYRGIARVNRMERLDMTSDERQQAREDLVATIGAYPEDRDANYYLAAWHILEARAVKQLGQQQEQVDSHYHEAKQITSASLDAHPDDPRRQMDRLRVLRLINDKDDKQGQEEANQLLARLEKRMLDQPTMLRLILELVELIPEIDQEMLKPQGGGRPATTSGLVRAGRVLEAAVAANPAELRYRATLGRVLEAQRRHQDAIEQYKQVCELEANTNAFEGIQLDRLKAGATIKYVGLTLKQLDSMTPVERQKLVEEVDVLMDSMVTNYGELPQVSLLQGKIAMARGQWGKASTKLDFASSQFKDAAPEALWLSAKAWVQMGEVGAATDRLEQLAKIRADYMPARYELIRLNLQLNQIDEAKKHLDVVLKNDPDSPRARRAHASLLAQSGQYEQAIDIYLSLDPSQNPDLIPVLANLYVTVGDQESAVRILEDRFGEDPKDMKILQALVQVSRDAQQAKVYIQTARQSGADAQALDILESQFDGKTSLVQVLEGLIDTDEVPFRRHLKRFRMFSRLGQQEKANQELDEAARLEPNHPMVLSAQFDRALSQRDWGSAEVLADRAAELNIDMAEGMFYYGRLEARRGQHDRAVASYRRGLELRKIYSEGWRQLGDVYRQVSDWNGAAAAYRQAIEQRPNNIAALAGLAFVLNALDKQTEALGHLRKAARFSPKNTALRERYLAYEQEYGDPKRALDLRQRVAVAEPKNMVNQRVLALLLARVGRVDQAKQVIDGLMKQAGSDRLNIQAAASAYRVAGELDTAQKLIQDYVNGLGDQAQDEDWMMLARFLLSLGNDETAMAAYRQALKIEDPQRRRATREFADMLFERGHYVEAVKRYEQLWETTPDDKRVGHRYVEALLRVNEPETARKVLSVVAEKHGVNSGTYVLESLIARAHGDTKAAMDALDKAAELEPRRAMIYYQRADLQASNPELEKAVVEDLKLALEFDPELSAARRLLATIHVRRGERSDAISELRALIRRHPQHVAARLQLAGLYADAGLSDLRRSLLAESASLYPKAAIWPQLQAQQALKDKNKSLAIQKLEEAYTLSRSPQTLAELSALLIQYGKADEALSLLRSEGEIVRNVALLHALRGRALMALDNSDLATRAFARAIEQSRTFKDLAGVAVQMSYGMQWEQTIQQLQQWAQGPRAGIVELAIVQIEVETKKYDDAMDRLKRIESLLAEGTQERLQYDRLTALVFYQQRKYEQALKVYERLLDQQPNNLVTLNNTAYLLAESLGRAEEAVPLAQRAVKLAPNNPLVLDTYGWTLFRTGAFESAYRMLSRSVQIKPSALNCLHFAEVLQEQGDISGAAEQLNRAKSIAEESDDEQNLWLASKRLDELIGRNTP